MTERAEDQAPEATVADVDHEAPDGAADPNAVWERGEESTPTEDDEPESR
ncbi:hypothetical protein [Halobaculum marinum]|uniref:Uncharacterized protein n=1 Tax=Halobaculum marinum TaxID=3031996 RepID=A0ABD5X197_9EURY|nr:hypothetical protein [Halobaculum sp. DT55]